MSTSNETSCRKPGCGQPVKTYPGARPSRLCARHESERVQSYKRAARVDPVTGEAVTVGVLAQRNWRRRRAALESGAES